MALTPFEQQRRQREAKRRLAAQRNRAGRLRGRVVAGSLICFVLLWAVVFGQMVTGNDPVLGDGSTTQAVARSEPQHPRRAQAEPADGATDALESTEPGELEGQLAEPAPVETEAPAEIEIEPEPEPLTTSQS